MNQTPSDTPFPKEWLAAYADGELGPAAEACVEAWLVEKPDRMNALESQEAFSPLNASFWEAAKPPLPGEAAWTNLFEGMQSTLRTRKPASSRLTLRMGTMLVAAVSLFIVALVNWPQPRNGAGGEGEPIARMADVGAEFDAMEESYPLAITTDVVIYSLPESANSSIVVGRHPMQEHPLELAHNADVQVLAYGPDEDGNMPRIQTYLGQDASMIIAAAK